MAVLAPPEPPSHDDLEALVKEARQRQLRRRLLGAAGVAVAAAIALGIYALTIGNSTPGNEAAPIGPAGVPLCRSSQLSSVPVAFGMAPGDVGGLGIKNVGSVSCSLPRTPRVAVYLGDRRLPVRQLPANGSVPDYREPAVHVLAPGKRAAVVFLWSNWCGAAPRGQATLRYFFGGGLVRSERWGEPTCASPGSPSTLRVAGPLG
jgi:hypothetical protein